MKKTIKKWIIVTMVTTLLVTILDYSREQLNSKAEEKDNSYGLCNPVIDENGVTTWDCVYFGNYPQSMYKPQNIPENLESGKEYTDVDGTKMVYQEGEKTDYNKYDEENNEYKKVKCNGYFKVEPIKWRVLKIDGNDAFLLADKNLDVQPYNTQNISITWGTSTLRTWLNSTFFNRAFTKKEQAMIKDTVVANGDTSYNGTEEGGNTIDKVYLLSDSEVSNNEYGFSEQYYTASKTREARNTDFAQLCGVDISMGTGAWWLRSSGYAPNLASGIGIVGGGAAIGVGRKDYSVNAAFLGNRPVLHINLSSQEWRKAGKVDSKNNGGPTPTPTGGTDTPSQNYSVKNPVVNSDGISTWDCVYFGSYPQNEYKPQITPENPEVGEEYTDVDGTKMIYQEGDKIDYTKYDLETKTYQKEKWQGYFKIQPIKWRVLSVNGDDAFLITDKNIDVKPYNKYDSDCREYVVWETSILRKWLNNVFVNNAFSSEEKKEIQDTVVVSEQNKYYSSNAGINTIDRIYLLSMGEACNEKYGFIKDATTKTETRSVENTMYVSKCGGYESHDSFYEGKSQWWLRTPGKDNLYTCAVDEDGYVNYSGRSNEVETQGIRPVLHLNLSSNVWKYAGKITSIGTETEENETPAPTQTIPPTSTSTPTITSTPVPTEKISPIVNRGNNTSIVSSTPKDTVIAPSKVTLTTAKNIKGAKIILKWKKVAGANGYQLQYATNKKFKAKKTKSTAKMKYTVKKLKKKKTYYVRVRAYTVSAGKKLYGKWSSVKKIKIKK